MDILELRKKALDEIANMNNHDIFARRYKNNLKFVHYSGVVRDGEMKDALEKYVLRKSKDYLKRFQLGLEKYADHVSYPEFLAYAIKKNEFSEKEKKAIPFDHGQTVENFCNSYYNDNLLDYLKDDLLNPEPFPEDRGYFDSHPSCCSCLFL
jgi:hypothetical protein